MKLFRWHSIGFLDYDPDSQEKLRPKSVTFIGFTEYFYGMFLQNVSQNFLVLENPPLV